MFLMRSKQSSRLWKLFKTSTARISSTEMSSVLNFHPKVNRERLYREKKGLEKRKDISDLPPIKHGRFYEPVARDKIYEYYKKDYDLHLPGTIFDPWHPICCSPDGMLFHKTLPLVKGLEIKCPFLKKNVPFTKENIPLEYLIQCFVCLQVTRADSWVLVFYDASDGVSVWYEIFPSRRLWKRIFLPAVYQFRTDLEGNDESLHQAGKRKSKMEQEKKKIVWEKLLEKTVPLFVL